MRSRLVALLAEAGPPASPPGERGSSGAANGGGAADGAARVARGARGQSLAPMPAAGGAIDPEGLDAQGSYIRSRLRNDLWGLVRQCYAAEVARNATAQGTVYLVFVILGDPSVGGVVDRATVDVTRSAPWSPTFTDCVENSMMTVEFSPPPSQIDVPVEYPMVLSPEDAYPEAGWW